MKEKETPQTFKVRETFSCKSCCSLALLTNRFPTLSSSNSKEKTKQKETEEEKEDTEEEETEEQEEETEEEGGSYWCITYCYYCSCKQ